MMFLNAEAESNEPHRIRSYLLCVALSVAEIMTRRRCRACADISICFISISDKAFHTERFILRRSLSPHFSFNQRLNPSRSVRGESVAARFTVFFFFPEYNLFPTQNNNPTLFSLTVLALYCFQVLRPVSLSSRCAGREGRKPFVWSWAISNRALS